MYKYTNDKGQVIYTSCPINGGSWKEVKDSPIPKKKTPRKKKEKKEE